MRFNKSIYFEKTVLKVREIRDPNECDHLDGIVFLEKVKGPNGFATKENIDKYNLRKLN